MQVLSFLLGSIVGTGVAGMWLNSSWHPAIKLGVSLFAFAMLFWVVSLLPQ